MKAGEIDSVHAMAIEQLTELEEAAAVPTERGGAYLTEWERNFLLSIREQFDDRGHLSEAQRKKIGEVYSDYEKGRAVERDAGAANLFSRLSPAEQRAQRERAAKVRLPWE